MDSITPFLSVVIEAPTTRDMRFFGEWFIAAHRAEMFWKKALKDRVFEKRTGLLTMLYIPDFEIAASELFCRLGVRSPGCTIRLDQEFANEFSMMAELGFFVPEADHHRMALPQRITSRRVKAAALKLAATVDVDCMLHPEELVHAISPTHAAVLLQRVRALDQFGDLTACGQQLH